MRARTSLLCLLVALLAAVPVTEAGTPDPGVKPPAEEGLYLLLTGGRLVKVPRFTGKPCDAATGGAPAEVSKVPGREKFLYTPVSALAQIPVVSSKDVEGAYFVSREEKLEGLRNVVSLAPYLGGRKILAGTYPDGCAEGEIADPGQFLAWSAWGWPFDKVIRATYVNETTSWLSFESRLPLEKGETRPIVGPAEGKIGSFGIFVATDRAFYPFIPDERLEGFLAGGPEKFGYAAELAGMMAKHRKKR